MRLVFLGPPGAGKGTQANLLSQRRGIAHISTGEILREAAESGSELGNQAKDFMDRGDLVPDELVDRIVAERLAEADCRSGFVLDGYPRTVAQARALDGYLTEIGRPLTAVLGFEVHQGEVTSRLLRRGRADDNKNTIRRRLRVYDEQTRELLDHYETSGLLKRISAVGAIDQVAARVEAALA